MVGAYKDAGISGASMVLRPGIQSLLQDAQAGQFDVVLAEALDRTSRDQADVATFYKHLQFAGMPIVTLAEGEISELHVGLKGTMNALFLKDLAAKTHRVLSGLKDRMMAPEVAAEAMRAYAEETNRLNREHRSSGDAWRAELVKVEKQTRSIIEAIKEGIFHPSMKGEMTALEARKAELTALLADVREDVPDILPSA